MGNAKNIQYYVMRDGKLEWKSEVVSEHRKNLEYSLLRHFKNNEFRVKVEWIGGPFPQSTPVKHAMPFKMSVWLVVENDYEGTPFSAPKEVPDKNEGGYYRTETEAIAAYEQFLVDNGTGSVWMPDANGDPRFIERSNSLTPPSPDLPSLPAEEEATPEQMAAIGSW